MKKTLAYTLARFVLPCAFLLLIAGTVLAQGGNEVVQFKGGSWQTIVDGKSGEGSFFYRLRFEEDGKVEVVKQFGGSDNLVEVKHWEQQG